MKKRTKISVGVITYNQQDYIRQTLDSILMQKGDFDLELVIGEDCSSDNTFAICQEYAERYPAVVRLLPNSHNLGIMANFARVIKACTGDYIADMAGDDYYCDDHALEKQMNYIQLHPEVGVLGANGYQFFVRRNKKIAGFNPTIEAGQDKAKEFFFSPSYKGGIYLWPIGMMYRASVLTFVDFEEIIRRKLPVEDYPIQAILSQHTRFACLPDLLITYRVYKESASFISFAHPKYMEYHRGLAETRRYLNELFPDDACFSEAQLQEQLFYKEFLLYLHLRDYSKAKSLITNVPELIADSAKVQQAKRFTRTRLHFLGAHLAKEFRYKKEIRRLT